MINWVSFLLEVTMENTMQGLRRTAQMLFCLMMTFSILAGCVPFIDPITTPNSPPGQSQTAIPTPAKMDCLEGEKDFTDQIQNILQYPQEYIGKTVTLTGYYRGWDLLKEAQGTSPVTRNDWVLRDRCGAIYILARGGMELGLNPGEKSNTIQVVRLRGTVRITTHGQPYIEPQEVQLVR